jgi:hypothetical protein
MTTSALTKIASAFGSGGVAVKRLPDPHRTPHLSPGTTTRNSNEINVHWPHKGRDTQARLTSASEAFAWFLSKY